MPLKNSVFEAPKLVSTKTLLLKHYYRRQGFMSFFLMCFFCTLLSFSAKRNANSSQDWQIVCFLSEGSSLFRPFLFLSGGLLGTFHGTFLQSSRLQSTRL